MYILKKLEMSAVLFEIFLGKNVGKKDQNDQSKLSKIGRNQIREVIIICARLFWPFAPERDFLRKVHYSVLEKRSVLHDLHFD